MYVIWFFSFKILDLLIHKLTKIIALGLKLENLRKLIKFEGSSSKIVSVFKALNFTDVLEQDVKMIFSRSHSSLIQLQSTSILEMQNGVFKIYLCINCGQKLTSA